MDFSLSAEQETFLAAVKAFARDCVAPAAARIDETGEYPRELVAEAAALGLMGVTVPAAAGGAGRDYVSYALAMEAISQASATLAVILSVNNSLVAEPIATHGSPEQRDRWLRALATGQSIGAFALSEANAGSDAANQESVARPDGDGYVISGTKVWVANAEAADVAIVFASTEPGARGRGVSAFLVPLSAPGISRGKRQDSLGVRGLGCMDLVFDNVSVGADSRIGEAGRGFRLAMRALEGGRIAIAAQALGIGQAALEEALAYSRRRHAFGQPIGSFQTIQFQLADLATDLEAARMLIWRAASLHDHVDRVAQDAAMAKLHASEAAHRAADRAMQILASEGYRRGSTVERLFRDVRAAEIYQGTSEVQRMVIAEHVMDRRR
ncbi:MAG TPA: acyl-CoA dehydrogenase family protein [Vicinamibacterales bacterium]|nr:acyl-CoA dehydrogenase family protein [Vicinamibacterales bacterium]